MPGAMIDRSAFDAAYPAVADGVTLHAWREPAFRLVRWWSRVGLPAIALTGAAVVLCALTFALFWGAYYWPGLVTGFLFSLLATAAAQLARLAPDRTNDGITRAVDLIHPPLWWWAWEHGLAAYGRPLTPLLATMVLWVIVGGFAAQRIIEWLAVRRFGVAIDRWRPFDSRFRLVAADRNTDLVILLAAMLFGAPKLGLELVAWWTLISLIVTAVRFSQMNEHKLRGRPVASWFEP